MAWLVRVGVASCVVLGCNGGDGAGQGTTGGASTGETSTSQGATTQVSTGADSQGTTASTTASTSEASTTEGGDSTGGTTSNSSTTASDDDSSTGAQVGCAGTFPAQWPDGTACGSEDAITVHQYDENTFILRQSLCTSFEGPFLYLLFGEDRVLLEDTGDGGIPIADVVYGVIDDWLVDHGKNSIELVVVNSHAHGDHVAGNGQFEGQPNTTVVGTSVAAVSTYFGIENWPVDTAAFDLGNRVVDVVPIPGHQASHIALLDHGSNLLLTGDTLYPGRLYIADFAQYETSIGRLVNHVADQTVCWVLGTHIEMTAVPGDDFPFGAMSHPNERELELTLDHLLELQQGVEAMANPVIEVHDDFIIYPL
jgi:glyoxylase-like metal-dependent hydrolase (beta-lactamase superfamily II)